MAPSIYMATAVEVVRRRAFSEQYLKKATSIADTFCTLHDEELSLRMNFQVMNILNHGFWDLTNRTFNSLHPEGLDIMVGDSRGERLFERIEGKFKAQKLGLK